MAKQVKTWLTDDMESAKGNEIDADQTVVFSLDGNEYEIDLSAKNATKLRNDIGHWARCARQVGGRRKRSLHKAPAAPVNDMDAEQRRACREWLRNNTEEWKNIGARGRIPDDALAAFNARPAVDAVEFSSAGA